jgi:hypothetical protein
MTDDGLPCARARRLRDALPAVEQRFPPRRLRWHENKDWHLRMAAKGWIAPAWPVGVRRHGPVAVQAADLLRGAGTLGIDALPGPRRADGGSGADALRHRGAEAPVPAGHPVVRGRSGARATPSRTPAPTWPACARAPCATATTSSSRPEDLDHAGARRHPHVRAGAHRPGRQEAAGHQLPAARLRVARRAGAPDPRHRRPPRSSARCSSTACARTTPTWWAR